MSRKGPPESDPLWAEMPADDSATRSGKTDPPDWALPAWDSFEDSPVPAPVTPKSATSTTPAQPVALR